MAPDFKTAFFNHLDNHPAQNADLVFKVYRLMNNYKDPEAQAREDCIELVTQYVYDRDSRADLLKEFGVVTEAAAEEFAPLQAEEPVATEAPIEPVEEITIDPSTLHPPSALIEADEVPEEHPDHEELVTEEDNDDAYASENFPHFAEDDDHASEDEAVHEDDTHDE